jgi:hypothetical protein
MDEGPPAEIVGKSTLRPHYALTATEVTS